MCEQGAGWSLAFASHRKHPPPGLVAIPVDGFRIPWGVNLISRKNEARPAARAIIDLLFEESANRNRAATDPAMNSLQDSSKEAALAF
jgi:hypothetical protein